MSKLIKADLYSRIRAILESARTTIARSVNTTQVIANWLVGREIIEDEQHGKVRAVYGGTILLEISQKLQKEFGTGYSIDNLELFRRFYAGYPDLISDALRRKSANPLINGIKEISDASPRKSDAIEETGKQHALRVKSGNGEVPVKIAAIRHAPVDESWKPGILNHNLSWTHYRTLLKVKSVDVRNFYEIESVRNGWSARQLERQINSLLFERLLKSRDKKGVIALANKGQEISKPIDIMKEPIVLEFLDLPESHRLVETKVETALISKLKDFLLELGSGFAYVGRQRRLTLEGDHFYPDLVFYHIKLKCYVIIDLKTQKLTHGDLGQMQMYVHYYDREIKSKNENPTIGLILCTDKNDAVVKYVLDEKQRQIFTSRYQYELPTVEALKRELRREMELLSLPEPVKNIRKSGRRSK
jgi:predicted nuclease of restriction endonuclease-like (RecB) superfamily